MKIRLIVSLLLFAPLFWAGGSLAAETGGKESVPGIPVKDMVTVVDLGAKSCIPCKMMAPILEELKKEYAGKAEVIFIDVWDKANEGKAEAFKIQGIPTQIFYDRNGKETARHMGFMSKEDIRKQLDALIGGK